MQTDLRSHGLWEQTAPLAPETEILITTINADVVIIGAGYTGLSAALHLAEAGSNVVVLEAAQIGFGGSGRNAGLVNAGMWVLPDALPRTLGPVYGARLLSLLGDAPSEVFSIVERFGIECEPVRNGTLHCAPDRKGLRELATRADQWRRLGAPVELLDAQTTARLTGTTAYRGALLDKRAGTIQPLAYARGLARAAMVAGARVFTASPVTAAMRSGDQWLIDTAHGRIRAPKVIVATNAYSQGPFAEIVQDLMPLRYFNVATAPLPEAIRASILPGGQGVWDTRQVLSSFRLDAAGRLVFGSVGALDRWEREIHLDYARRELARLYPQLAGIGFEFEWYGTIGMTPSHLPRFHRLAPGMVGFAGYNGRGIAPGTVFGRVLADLTRGVIQEGDLPLPVIGLPGGNPFRALRGLAHNAGSCAVHLASCRF